MDLELGLKITKTRDDIASISEYRLAKDRAGPVFESRETNTMLILSAHLKGYKKNNINIKISEDGRKITISGEKPIQEILMMGWMMHKKEVDVTRFNKIFKIPEGVNLDRIKAKYDDEEWILNIFMPKLVKGICGARIEEVKEEQKSDGGRSELEKREVDHILGSVGETSQKGSKEFGVKAMEDSESSKEKKEGGVSDKKLEDANRGTSKETIQKEVEESKLGIGESVREKVGKEGDEVMKTSELEQSVGVGISQKIEETCQKEKEESMLRIKDGKVKNEREEVGKVAYEGVKKSEIEVRGFEEFEIHRSVGVGITSQDEEFVEKKDTNRNIIGEVIQKKMEESKSGIEDRDGESVKEKIGKEGYEVTKTSELEKNVGAHITQVSQGVSKEPVIKQMEEAKSTAEKKMEREESGKMLVKASESSEEETVGESKQKSFKPETVDRFKESVKESSMELKKTMKTSELDQNVADHIPSQEEFNKSRIQQKEKIDIIEEKMGEGKSEGMPLEASKDSPYNIFRDSIQKGIKKPKIERDGDQDSVGGKAGMEGFDAMITTREEFPKKLPKATIEESEGLSVLKMQETEDVKDATVKRKGKETDYFMDRGEGEEPRRVLVEAKKDLKKESMQETEDVKEAIVKRKGNEVKYVDKSKGEEPKRMPKEVKKDLIEEKTPETEDVNELMLERKGKEIGYYVDKGESEELGRMHMEEEKDLTEETMQETEDVPMVKRKGKEIEYFGDKVEGEDPKRMHMKAKEDVTKKTMRKTEDVKETMVKRKGMEVEFFVDKGNGEEPKRMHMEAKEDLTKETMQETDYDKEAIIKRKGMEVEFFVDKGDGEEPKRMHMEAKEDLTKETMQETDYDKEAMIKRKGMEVGFFVDKGDGEKPKRMHMEAKEDLTKETMQETVYDKEAMIKRKGMEVEFFVDKGDGEKPKRMHMEAKEDLTKETMQTDYDREAMIKRKGMEVEFFVAKGEGEEPKRMHMEAKEDLTEETMQEAEDDKEEMVKRKGMEVGFFIDKGEGEGEEPKRMHMEAKEDLTKETVQDTEDVKEAIVKRNGKGIDYFVDKGGGEELKRMHMEAKEDMTRETMQEEIKNGIKNSDQQNIWEKTVKGRFGKPKNITEELPKQVQEHDGSKGFKVSKREEQKEVIKEAMFETESLTEKVEGEESKKRTERTSRVIEKSTETETSKETEEFNIERNARDGPYIPDNMVKGVFDVSGTVQAKFPKHVVDAIAQDMKDKNKYVTVKFKGEGSINIHVEPNEAYDEDTTLNRIQEEIRKPKLKPGDQISGKENVDIEALDESKRTKFPEMRETDVKKEGAKIEESVKKENGDKYEKIQVEAKGGIRKDITKESTRKEREGPKILTKEKDQQLLQEMSTARVEASKATKKEFRAKMVDSLDEAEEVKEELVKQKSEEKKTKDVKEGAEIEQFVKKVKGKAGKRKSEETKAVETATKEKMQEPESERIVQTLQEPEDKHPKVLKTGTPERESQYEKGSTTQEKVESRGFKEVEQKRAKEKTQMLPPKIQSKETHESKIESENQDILKPKKEKEVKGKQTENTKKIATMEDQVAKPLSAPSFPSTPQSEVEAKDKLYRGGKEKYEAFLESQREDPTKDMKNLIDMRETQESKQTETLKPEIPLEEHLKRGAQVNKKDKFHKGQESGETMQEETEGLKDIYDDRDQQFMQRDVGKGVEKVDTSGKEMLKREYVADAGSIAERMETKRDMETTPERDKYITDQKVKDEKARIQEENINVDFEKEDKAKYTVESFETTQEKEHRMKLGVEKEAESLEAISSLPSVISMGVEGARLTKNEIEEIQEEELSTLTAEMKSEDPLELEKPITEWKVPKTKSYVAEPRGREQYGYGKEDIKEPKISAYQGAKPSKFQTITPSEQSLDEEDRRSENVVEAQETSKGFEEKEKVDGKKINQEETKVSKISIQDRNQQPMQENNDKKGYETRKVIEEEMLKPKHRAEVVLEKREGPKVTKSEETKEASRQQLKREREKPTQTEEDKKHKMKEITPEFKKASGFKQIAEKMPKTREKDHKIESEEVTPKMMVKSPTTIEITPKKGIEKSKEEKSAKPMAFPRKEPHELSWSSKDYKIPKIEDVQQEKERERPIHTLGTTAPEEEEIAQAKAMHLKSKSDDELKDETGKPHVNQLPLPSKEMLSKESCEFDKLSVKEDDSKVEDSVQMQERKELISSTEDTTASEVISDEVAEPSKLSSSSKDKKDASHDVGKQESQDSEDSKIDGQESTKGKTDQEVEKRETLQPESPADHEESHEIQEFEEEKAYEQGDEACEYSQELEEQKESKEEGTGGKKDNTKRSKKLFVSLIIAGSALLASGIFIFIRHRRSRKSVK